jgi:hypothetical protein
MRRMPARLCAALPRERQRLRCAVMLRRRFDAPPLMLTRSARFAIAIFFCPISFFFPLLDFAAILRFRRFQLSPFLPLQAFHFSIFADIFRRFSLRFATPITPPTPLDSAAFHATLFFHYFDYAATPILPLILLRRHFDNFMIFHVFATLFPPRFSPTCHIRFLAGSPFHAILH